MKRTKIKLLDTVALVKDMPEFGLVSGQVGTVVELHSSSAFEIEFANLKGETIAELPLAANDIMLLHYEKELANS
ncbi:MAG: DUF4926 domain-containing protein [Imperialibacter sp.]|jgi:hypothetical protein